MEDNNNAQQEHFRTMQDKYYSMHAPVYKSLVEPPSDEYDSEEAKKRAMELFIRNSTADNLDLWEQSTYFDYVQDQYLKAHPYDIDDKLTEEYRSDRILLLISVQQTGTSDMVRWANERIWVESVGFIKWFAREKFGISGGVNHDLYNTLMQEAYFHLFSYVRLYDPDKGKYTTFLRTWVNKYMSEDFSKWIYKTEDDYLATSLNKLQRAITKCTKLKIEPTVANLSEITGFGMQRTEILMTVYINTTQTVPYDENLDIEADYGNPTENIIAVDRRDSVERAMDDLAPEEREVLRRVYDFDNMSDSVTMTLVAKQMGMHPEQVKKLLYSAERKMKKSQHLIEYGFHEEKRTEGITRSIDYIDFMDSLDDDVFDLGPHHLPPVEGRFYDPDKPENVYFE